MAKHLAWSWAKSLWFGEPKCHWITAIVWHVSIVLGAWVSLEAENWNDTLYLELADSFVSALPQGDQLQSACSAWAQRHPEKAWLHLALTALGRGLSWWMTNCFDTCHKALFRENWQEEGAWGRVDGFVLFSARHCCVYLGLHKSGLSDLLWGYFWGDLKREMVSWTDALCGLLLPAALKHTLQPQSWRWWGLNFDSWCVVASNCQGHRAWQGKYSYL